MGDLTLFEAITGGAFDQIFQKSSAPGFALGGGGEGGWAVLELTGALHKNLPVNLFEVLIYMLQLKHIQV